jgi:hypothetical protein
MKGGNVYFIECAGRIKIGFSTDVKNRMYQLATSAPSKLTLIATISGTYQLERAVQKHLLPHRVKGEWFHDCVPVRTAIDDLVARGPSAIGHVEKERKPTAAASAAQVAITNVIKQKRPYGTRPFELLSEISGISERVAKKRLSNHSSYTAEELQKLIQSEDGWDYLKALMAGDKKPRWWADSLAAEKVIAKHAGMRAGGRR